MNTLFCLLSLLLAPALQERTPVTPVQPAANPGPRVYAIYDIADLVRPATGAGSELDASLREELRRVAAERLMATVKTFLVPPFDHELDELNGPAPDTIVALCTQAQQAWIQQFLDLQRRSEGHLLDVQTRIVTGPRGAFGELLGTDRSATTIEDPAVLEGLLRHFDERPGFEVIAAPRLLVAGRQRAEISTFTQVAYVKEYRLRVIHPGGQELADPVVETIREGVEVQLVGTPIEDGLYALELELGLTKLERPIATRVVRVRAGEQGEFEVGMPEVNTVAVESLLILADGATAVLLAASPTEDRDLAVFIALKVVAPLERAQLERARLESESASGELRTPR